jgi:cobyric acid synthase
MVEKLDPKDGGAVGDWYIITSGQVMLLVQLLQKYQQSEAANADADTEANRLLKIKKKGRSQSIMTGSKGVTKTSTDYSLGKKSLLGRV